MPLANSYIRPEQTDQPDLVFPLHARVCERCFLVQLDHIVNAQAIFSDYAYFSSFSSDWLEHAKRFAKEMIQVLKLGKGDFVVEVASNDGYLLKNFVAANIGCLGIEPANNVAATARAAGVPTEITFFGLAVAQDIVAQRGHASLVIANNVLAHVPDVNDFVAGLAYLAGASGLISIEVPHLLQLIQRTEFDTIYHEHYAYWSLHAMAAVFEAHALNIADVKELPTHGGSLRVFARRSDTKPSRNVAALRAAEAQAGIADPRFYERFGPQVERVIAAFREYLGEAHTTGRRVAAYGAAAKGNTFLNAGKVTAGDIMFVADRNPHKQGHLLPGSRIPIVAPEVVLDRKPDDLIILPWNVADEIVREMAAIRQWGGRFVIGVPKLHFLVPADEVQAHAH
jgi:C-methyltransferase C-terminal domain/Putative zinc binding domain/Methyltransferase domain